MWSKKQYLDMVSLFLQARPPKPHELRPCYEHELLLNAICRPKELTKDELTDLVWNMTNGPKKKTSKSRRRQSGGMDVTREPTDAEVIFGGCVKTPLYRCGWERSRIDWLRQLERQQRQYYRTWEKLPRAITDVKEVPPKRSKEELKVELKVELKEADLDRSKVKIKRPGCWALLSFVCGWFSGH